MPGPVLGNPTHTHTHPHTHIHTLTHSHTLRPEHLPKSVWETSWLCLAEAQLPLPFSASHSRSLSEPTPNHRLTPLGMLFLSSSPSQPSSPPPPLGWSEVQISLLGLMTETSSSPQDTSSLSVASGVEGPSCPTILNENFHPNL